MKSHWLYNNTSIKKLWQASCVILVLLILAELFIELHGYFTQVDFFAFSALFGFISCVIMIVFARILGFIIKRKDDYYRD